MDSTDIGPKRHLLPRVKDVDCEIVSWAPSEADVDLSIACMFEREMPGAHLAGGLLQLDEALGGALTRLREEGYFRAQEMETFLVQTPPQLVRARRVLLIGLGNPLTLSSAILERALRVAVREAVRLGATTVAFAPNLLDAGLRDVASLQVEVAMVRGASSALLAEYRLSELGLASPPAIQRWSFDVGPSHFDSATASFTSAFESLAVE
jgi:hypothetical protein